MSITNNAVVLPEFSLTDAAFIVKGRCEKCFVSTEGAKPLIAVGHLHSAYNNKLSVGERLFFGAINPCSAAQWQNIAIRGNNGAAKLCGRAPGF